MAAANYDASLKHVLVHEGGYSNHPADPGGATMKGVIQRVYDTYRDSIKAPRQPVKLIANSEIATIYRTQYADKVRFDLLPAGVDYVVFDGGVNSGPGQSIKWLQRALGVTADGVIGTQTLAKVGAMDPIALIDAICDQRMAFLRNLKTFPTFGKGWTSRVSGVRSVAKQMATNYPKLSTPTVPSVKPEAPATKPPVIAPASPSTINGAGIAAAFVAIGTALYSFWDWIF